MTMCSHSPIIIQTTIKISEQYTAESRKKDILVGQTSCHGVMGSVGVVCLVGVVCPVELFSSVE